MDHEDNYAAIRNLRSPLFQLFVIACLFTSGLVQAQSAGDAAGGNAEASSHKAAASGSTSSELKELKGAISTQQQQIQRAPNFRVTDRGRLVFVCGRYPALAIVRQRTAC